jgi:hypothetical protein
MVERLIKIKGRWLWCFGQLEAVFSWFFYLFIGFFLLCRSGDHGEKEGGDYICIITTTQNHDFII